MTDEEFVRGMADSLNSMLLPSQSVSFDPDDYRLACIASDKWKTNYHDSHNLCCSIIQWRFYRVPIQRALDFLNADEREFLMTGHTPQSWREIFPPLTVEDGDEQFKHF